MILVAVIYVCALVMECLAVQLPLTYSIEEEQPTRTIVADVRRDSGLVTKHSPSELSAFSFKFLKQRPEFSMNASNGVIRIASPLDRDVICPSQKTCIVEVDVAVFSGKHVSHVIKVLFDVQDINDNTPLFPQKHKHEFISEATSPGVLFPIQQAEDIDSPEHGIVDYQLIPEGPTFGLKKERGTDGYFDLHLVLKQAVDRELQDFYQLKIIASDGGHPSKSGSVMLHIEISDIDDNDPVFLNGTYSVEIAENLPPQTSLLSVRATDADQGRNAVVLYSFSPRTFSHYGDRFSVDRFTGLISLLKPLDYEQARELSLEVEARGEGEAAVPVTATVLVTVRDVNDNDPVINLETTYADQSGHSSGPVVYVTENCPEGTFVTHFSVTDADGGNNGLVYCSLISPQFRLSKKYDSEYTILTDADLDREYLMVHHVVVTCHDSGQSARSSVINITVVIDDVNDNSPVFSQAVYNWSIVENNPLNVLIGQVLALDPDKDENGSVLYELNSDADGKIEIDPETGRVTAAVIFDHEVTHRLLFHVTAVDRSVEKKFSTALVTVEVIDINDEWPHFVQDMYTFHVADDAPTNHEVGRLFAYDRDSAPFNRFTFYMMMSLTRSAASSLFEIAPETGSLLTKRSLRGAMERSVYNLTVVVQSESQPRVTDTATVVVHVVDSQEVFPEVFTPSISHDPLSDGSTYRIAAVVNMRPDAHALIDYDGFGWLRHLPFGPKLGGLQLALFISLVTCGLVFLSILCVTLARVVHRRQRVHKSTRRSSVPAADVTFWSNAERISLVGKPSDASLGDASTVGGLPLPVDADSGSDDMMAPNEFRNELNYDRYTWRNSHTEETLLPPPLEEFLHQSSLPRNHDNADAGPSSVRYYNSATARPAYQPRVTSIGDQFQSEPAPPRLNKRSTFSDCQLDSCGVRPAVAGTPISSSSNNTPSHYYNNNNNNNGSPGNHASTLERRTVRFNDEYSSPRRLQNELAARIQNGGEAPSASFLPPPLNARIIVSAESMDAEKPM